MRQLTDQEKSLTEKNLKRNQEELKILSQNLEYNLALIKRQKETRDFDDTWREYLRNQKDSEDQKVIKIINEEIGCRNETIKLCEDQLNNGVEERPNPLIQ